jgi:hypothetical protein
MAKAAKVETYRDKYFTTITYEYRGRKYDVTYPNGPAICATSAKIQHEDAQRKIDKDLDNPKPEGEPIDLDEIWNLMGW